jgi:hypothetical protein
LTLMESYNAIQLSTITGTLGRGLDGQAIGRQHDLTPLDLDWLTCIAPSVRYALALKIVQTGPVAFPDFSKSFLTGKTCGVEVRRGAAWS